MGSEPLERLCSRESQGRREDRSPQPEEVTQMQGLDSSLIFLVLVGVVFYFMLYRPNKRRIDQHRSLIESVEVGDEVVTIGGLFGTVRQITDDAFHLELAPGTTVKLAKSAIARRVEPETAIQLDETEDEGSETSGGAPA